MDIYDFIEYFTNKYNLRKHIIYNDDIDIVDSVVNTVCINQSIIDNVLANTTVY